MSLNQMLAFAVDYTQQHAGRNFKHTEVKRFNDKDQNKALYKQSGRHTYIELNS